MTDWDRFPYFPRDAGTSQDMAEGPPVHTQSVRPREAGSGQMGNTTGLLEAMWLPLLPDHGLTHPGMGYNLALGLSQGQPSPHPMSVVSLGVVQCEIILSWRAVGLGLEAQGEGSLLTPAARDPFPENHSGNSFHCGSEKKVMALVRQTAKSTCPSLGCLSGMYSLEEATSFPTMPVVESTRLMHRHLSELPWSHPQWTNPHILPRPPLDCSGPRGAGFLPAGISL